MPGWSELLTGPFVGLAVYRRVVRLPLHRPLLVLVLGSLALATLAAGSFHLRWSSELRRLQDTQLWLMPALTIEDGEARFEGEPGSVYDAGKVVVVVDPRADLLAASPTRPGEQRPIVLLGGRALVVYFPAKVWSTAQPWLAFNEWFGPLSVDGPELVAWLRDRLPMLSTLRWLALGPGFVSWQLLVGGLFALGYRGLMSRGRYAASGRALAKVACTAALPPLALAWAAASAGVAWPNVLGLHALLLGLLFFVAASQVSLGDEKPESTEARVAGGGADGATGGVGGPLALPPAVPPSSAEGAQPGKGDEDGLNSGAP